MSHGIHSLRDILSWNCQSFTIFEPSRETARRQTSKALEIVNYSRKLGSSLIKDLYRGVRYCGRSSKLARYQVTNNTARNSNTFSIRANRRGLSRLSVLSEKCRDPVAWSGHEIAIKAGKMITKTRDSEKIQCPDNNRELYSIGVEKDVTPERCNKVPYVRPSFKLSTL